MNIKQEERHENCRKNDHERRTCSDKRIHDSSDYL